MSENGEPDSKSQSAGAGQDNGNDGGNAGNTDGEGGLISRLWGAFRNSDDTQTGPDFDPEPGSSDTPRGMVNLRRMRVEDVALPSADIVSVPSTITKKDLVSIFRESGLTRLPVYDGTLDTPIGFVHLKDFALQHGFNGTGQRYNIRSMLRTLLYVPPSMPIGILLAKMQAERRHMALVIDEYGGVDGLVTIEDLIEQVVGEIEDEHDTEDDKLWVQEKSGSYLAYSKTPLDEFQAVLGIDLTAPDEIDPEEIDTLGGLVFLLAGRVPVRGEMVPHPSGVNFEVVDADPRRVKRLRVRLPGHPAGE